MPLLLLKCTRVVSGQGMEGGSSDREVKMEDARAEAESATYVAYVRTSGAQAHRHIMCHFRILHAANGSPCTRSLR